MLFELPTKIPKSLWPWPSFAPDEPNLACPCCGEIYLDVGAMNRLQGVRDALRKPVRINSGHRCAIHNARVGGAPLSQHKLLAFDIRLAGHDRIELCQACRQAGFTGFGFYQTFLHVDTGPARSWFGKGAFDLWKSAGLFQPSGAS